MSRPVGATLGRRLATRWLTHTYTRTPSVDGIFNSEHDQDAAEGAPVSVQLCLYAFKNERLSDELGVRTLSTPTLTVDAADPLAAGDQVSNITDATGALLLAGPATVETVDPKAQMGASLVKVATLRGATVVRSL